MIEFLFPKSPCNLRLMLKPKCWCANPESLIIRVTDHPEVTNQSARLCSSTVLVILLTAAAAGTSTTTTTTTTPIALEYSHSYSCCCQVY